MASIELPFLPDRSSGNSVPRDQFTRKKLRTVLHLITGELKLRGTKTPHIFLPFRSRVNDEKLNAFLEFLFPHGELIHGASREADLKERIAATDEFTLVAALKYFWSRLPNNEIIGWNVYVEFKRREKEAGYPKSAFLTIMPKCLLSPAHASIVYDFLDLIINIASNSQYNYLSGRKIAKMSSLWAFNHLNIKNHKGSAFYDATFNNENNFLQGLDAWKGYLDALFHLILSFLRAMLPDTEKEALRLPKTLQSLLITCSYPPMLNTDSLKASITIPCICVHSTRVSSTPYELISKVNRTLSFEKKDKFLSIENFTILKNIFQKESTDEIVHSLTEESRRILNRITQEPVESGFDLVPGWSRHFSKPDPDIPNYATITIENVTLQDYYIWTWLSTLSSDQSDHMKKLFGRSLVVEAGLRGFQKWLIVTESRMTTDEYLSLFKRVGSPTLELIGPPPPISKDEKKTPKPKEKKRIKISTIPKAKTDLSYKKKSMPPLPGDAGFLPQFNFEEEDSKIDLSFNSSLEESNISDTISSPLEKPSDFKDYRVYLENLSDNSERDDSLDSMNGKSKSMSPAARNNRRKPPPLSIIEPAPSAAMDNKQHMHHSPSTEPVSLGHLPPRPQARTNNMERQSPIGSPGNLSPVQHNEHSKLYSGGKPTSTSEFQQHKVSQNSPYEKHQYRRPPTDEGYENYEVMGLDRKVESTSSVSEVDDSEMNRANKAAVIPDHVVRLSDLPSPTVDQFSPKLERKVVMEHPNTQPINASETSPKKKSKKKSNFVHGFDMSNLPPGPPPPLHIPLDGNPADSSSFMSPPGVPHDSFFPSSPVINPDKKQGSSPIPPHLLPHNTPNMDQIKRFTTDEFQLHVPGLSQDSLTLGSGNNSAEKLPPSSSHDTRNTAARYSRDRELPATPRDSASDIRSSNTYSKGQSPNNLSLGNASPSSLSTIPVSAQKSPTEKEVKSHGYPPQNLSKSHYAPLPYPNNGAAYPTPNHPALKDTYSSQQPGTRNPVSQSPTNGPSVSPPRPADPSAPVAPVQPGVPPQPHHHHQHNLQSQPQAPMYPGQALGYPAYPANYPYQPQQYPPQQYPHPSGGAPSGHRKSGQPPQTGANSRGSHQRISQTSSTSASSSKQPTPTIPQHALVPQLHPPPGQMAAPPASAPTAPAAVPPPPMAANAAAAPPPPAPAPPAPGYPPYYYYPPPPAGYPAYGTPPANPGQAPPPPGQPYGYPPPPAPQQYPYPYPYAYPPYGYPPQQQAPPAAKEEKTEKPRVSDLGMNGIPSAGRHNKNTPINRVGLRHAFQKDFGI